MAITLGMLVPVILFLMWLYWFTRPQNLSREVLLIDNVILWSSPVVCLATGLLVYRYLPGEGIWPHVLAALLAYLMLLADVGAGWMMRFMHTRKNKA
ncbi:MAG: hypothetical protein MI750_05565 [Xanthomonadales bacterium]|nr:hypothetical protein [Xanthomonadales bacterium]